MLKVKNMVISRDGLGCFAPNGDESLTKQFSIKLTQSQYNFLMNQPDPRGFLRSLIVTAMNADINADMNNNADIKKQPKD